MRTSLRKGATTGPEQAGYNVIRTVTENSRTLKFTTHGFENG